MALQANCNGDSTVRPRKLTKCIKEIEDVDFPTAFKEIKGTDLILTKREEDQTALQKPIKGHQEGL